MKISNTDTSFFAGAPGASNETAKQGQSADKAGNITVSGANIANRLSGKKSSAKNGALSGEMDQRTASAREKAAHIIKGVWEKQDSIEKALDDGDNALKRMVVQKNTLHGRVEKDYEKYGKLAEEYADTEKGENEASDLALLIRAYRDPQVLDENYNGPGAFSDEEKERYSKIDTNNLTAYQDDMYSAAKRLIDDVKTYNRVTDGINSLASSLTRARIDILKQDPMVKAQKEADNINEQAMAANMLALIGEGIEAVDEKQEEKEEQAEKIEKKKEEQEKQKAEAKNKSEDNTKVVEEATKELEDAEKELDKIIKDMGAFSDRLDDLYGLLVDTTV